MSHQQLKEDDYVHLGQAGISRDEAERQLAVLRAPKRPVTLVRPCTLGDGIQSIADEEQDPLISLHHETARAGRWLKFVPASGAASRMFAFKEPSALAHMCENLSKFAFYEDLQLWFQSVGKDLADLLDRKAYSEIASGLLDEQGLGYRDKPKGLLKFHRYPGGSRTAFEEHLREAAHCFRSEDGRCHAHFTVSENHRPQFDEIVARLQPVIREQCDADLDVGFSVQTTSTDMLALDENGDALRDDDGKVVVRPGGHGALLENLNDLRGDLIFVKNIDNVSHERLQSATRTWAQTLGGHLTQLQREVHAHVRSLISDPSDDALQQAEEFVSSVFPGLIPDRRVDGGTVYRRMQLQQMLNRPLRVCGVVRNEGEPGGGPFWVREADGSTSLQIVESVEIDGEDSQQTRIFEQATHFNPVFMAVGVRDYQGDPFDLRDFVNRDRFILTQKVDQGRTLRVLERPGLWNGAMGGWITVFVQVPIEVFSPVKTIFDLLRAEHREEEKEAEE